MAQTAVIAKSVLANTLIIQIDFDALTSINSKYDNTRRQTGFNKHRNTPPFRP